MEKVEVELEREKRGVQREGAASHPSRFKKGKRVKTAVTVFIQSKTMCILNRNPWHEKNGERLSKLVLGSVKHHFSQIILLVHLEGRC